MKTDKYIIWDWNGTLLDDVDICISCMNEMLRKREIAKINRSRYREIFTFPVINYYKKLGFDFAKEPFANLSVEYINLYREQSLKANLHNDVITTLNSVKSNNYSQIILSAMEKNALEVQVCENKIRHYFNEVIGLDNIHAKSKIDNGRQFLKRMSISPEDCIVVGDTYHDYEVAKELGCECVLINKGHQNLQEITFDAKVTILDDILEITDLQL